MAEPRPMAQAAGRDTVRIALASLITILLGPEGLDYFSVAAATGIGAALGVLVPRAWDALTRIPT